MLAMSCALSLREQLSLCAAYCNFAISDVFNDLTVTNAHVMLARFYPLNSPRRCSAAFTNHASSKPCDLLNTAYAHAVLLMPSMLKSHMRDFTTRVKREKSCTSCVVATTKAHAVLARC
eukprot:gnl/MRDRNA2_/MRDRNA2_149479_c0_seq1.p2 gnl/MRDRNA2_/MRDRNA2_149479_c0~~gnl/MRDRNA2_/MRDRNA2_149479_c0_seq1.p2  ORF type:complete len:119 (+),score=14.63 gnl/MRDRNA2_/MRDRNA2_149479_c0_seq1:401-757(+)